MVEVGWDGGSGVGGEGELLLISTGVLDFKNHVVRPHASSRMSNLRGRTGRAFNAALTNSGRQTKQLGQRAKSIAAPALLSPEPARRGYGLTLVADFTELL